MPMLRVRSLLHEFFAIAVDNYRLSSISLWTHTEDESIINRYERLIDGPVERRRNTLLTEEQGDLCFAELLSDESALRTAGLVSPISLWVGYEITAWKAGSRTTDPPSRLVMHYGRFPHLQTTLFFDSEDQFLVVKEGFSDVGLCTLNEKHFKLVKKAMTPPRRESA